MKTWTFPLLIVIISALVGCTPVGEVSPTPTDTEPSIMATPTPQWTDEEQEAVDAVLRYIDMWTYIGQNLVEADWREIFQVAIAPETDHNQKTWESWLEQGWHLEGSPVFEPSFVEIGVSDHSGQWYYVHGCYVIENSYISDKDGNSVGDEGRRERGLALVMVLRIKTGEHFVAESKSEEGAC